MHVTKTKYTRSGRDRNISLLTPTGRRPVDVRLVKIVYVCIHCLGRLIDHNAGVRCELNSTHYGYIHRDEAKSISQEERFMKLSEMFKSEYLRGIDIGRPITVTIKGVTAEKARNRKSGELEQEYVMHFNELDKKLRLNVTMAKECAKIINDPDMDTDNWIGKRVTVYRVTIQAFGEEHIVPRIRATEKGDIDLAKAIKQAQPAKNGSSGPSSADLLKKLNEDFGLDEVTAKTLLKDELGYTGFRPEKFQEMYDSVKAIVPKGEPAQNALFEADEQPTNHYSVED